MKHLYSLIRYVPDPIRGEFVNVGAIAGSDESSEWEVRQVENPARARQFDERGTLSAVWAFIDRLGRQVDAHEEAIERPRLNEEMLLSEDWLRELHRGYRNIIQLSDPMPISAESTTLALDQVFQQLIVDNPARQRGGDGSKHSALAAVRRAYRDSGVKKDQNLFERVLIEAGSNHERLDFAVANGRVVQLTQTWSFRVADQESLAESVRAWGWMMNAIKNGGGTVSAGNRQVPVPGDVDVAVVVVPPETGREAPALKEAEAVFSDVAATVSWLDGAEVVAKRAASLLHPTAAS
jgi:hypothetical protein